MLQVLQWNFQNGIIPIELIFHPFTIAKIIIKRSKEMQFTIVLLDFFRQTHK